MLAIVSYPAGNQTSVARAFKRLGIDAVVSADPQALAAAHGLIFPGVGAAGSAMSHLRATGLADLLTNLVGAGKPLLGICLGCQIILDFSQENGAVGLGLLPGQCRRFVSGGLERDGTPLRIPHMGWNSVRMLRPCRLLNNIPQGAEFYFVHSYYPDPAQKYVLAMTEYGREFCSVLGRDGLWAVQFHPEKSGEPGLKILGNFYEYCREAAHA